mgnify:CR=1 FL=1
MTATVSDLKSLFEIGDLKVVGYDLWDMTNVAWIKLNTKAITYIKTVVSDEIFVDLMGLTNAFEVWEKLKVTYEIMMLVNQVHPMHKLVCMQLDESKSATKHLFAITSNLSKIAGLHITSLLK